MPGASHDMPAGVRWQTPVDGRRQENAVLRLDKFLKVSRLIKRRTLANELCDRGHAQINGAPAKASAEVRAGQRLTLRLGPRRLTVEILLVPEKAVPAQLAETLYRVLADESAS